LVSSFGHFLIFSRLHVAPRGNILCSSSYPLVI
jgi:hypothetical protein